MVDRTRDELVVAYFLSRCGEAALAGGPPRPPSALRVATWNEAYALFYAVFGQGRTARSFRNSLKNARDAFDSHLDSGRVGWRESAPDRPPGALTAMATRVLAAWKDRSDRDVAEYALQFAGTGGRASVIHYWAFFANPRVYRINEAIHDLFDDSWVTRGKSLSKGDRFIVWKGSSDGKPAGIVTLGLVTSSPAVASDVKNPYWVGLGPAAHSELRVRVQYITAPELPLLTGGKDDSLLKELPVARARGGTVFRLRQDQWERIVDAAGGWRTIESDGLREAVEAVAANAGKRGQGFASSAGARKAVETQAVLRATKHYENLAWKVTDMSPQRLPYDLLLTKPEGEERRVEVKGTTGDGTSILLTPNEARHASDREEDLDLVVVSGIRLEKVEGAADRFQATGGQLLAISPWRIKSELLTPIGYQYGPVR